MATPIRYLSIAIFAWFSGVAAQGPAAPPVRGQVTIGPEDTVTIVALNVDEVSRAWRVSSAGELNLPMVGRIAAAGRTVEDVQREIADRLKEFVRDPQVTVFVSEFRSHPITVSGAVEHPGTQQLQGTTTLYSALVQAGGVKDAGPTVTLTRKLEFGAIPHSESRNTEDGYSVLEVPTQDAMRGFGDAADVVLRPYDVITVSQDKRQRMVYITGEVVRPGAIELVTQDTVSLTKAVAMAGGLTHSASPSHAMVRHIGANGVETAMAFIDVKRIMSGKVKDLLLSDGDIVAIPSNQIVGYLQSVSTTAVTAGIWVLGRL